MSNGYVNSLIQLKSTEGSPNITIKSPQISDFISVNFHLTKACNYQCKFCFAQFAQIHGHLGLSEAKLLIAELEAEGMRKITFVGGEPLLYANLVDLIKYSKSLGITTMIVTNGSMLSTEFLDNYGEHIDWIGLSIDSTRESVERELGRSTKTGEINHVELIKYKAQLIHQYGIKLKINTVVTTLNYRENISSLIAELNPARWKVFQVLELVGENSTAVTNFLITSAQFKHFIRLNRNANPVVETNEDMIGSYVMISPDGRFFNNLELRIKYSDPILEVGVKKAFNQIGLSLKKLINRNGLYAW